MTAVYPDPRRAAAVLFDVTWDQPAASDPAPWTGTSRGLPAAHLYAPGRGWAAGKHPQR